MLDPLGDDEKIFLIEKYKSLGLNIEKSTKRLLLLSSAILI
jgi:hypothetical protein